MRICLRNSNHQCSYTYTHLAAVYSCLLCWKFKVCMCAGWVRTVCTTTSTWYARCWRAGVGENSVHNYEYLVKWRGLEYGDATWERADDLRPDEEVGPTALSTACGSTMHARRQLWGAGGRGTLYMRMSTCMCTCSQPAGSVPSDLCVRVFCSRSRRWVCMPMKVLCQHTQMRNRGPNGAFHCVHLPAFAPPPPRIACEALCGAHACYERFSLCLNPG